MSPSEMKPLYDLRIRALLNVVLIYSGESPTAKVFPYENFRTARDAERIYNQVCKAFRSSRIDMSKSISFDTFYWMALEEINEKRSEIFSTL